MPVRQTLGQVNILVEQTLRGIRVHIYGDRALMNRERIVAFLICSKSRRRWFACFVHTAVSRKNRKQDSSRKNQ